MALQRIALVMVSALCAATATHAINITVDYTYDTNDFFGAGNVDGAVAGAQARAAIEAAADFLSEALTDSFSSISTPPDFESSVFSGVATWEWTQTFNHPGTGGSVMLTDQTINQDAYIIYAGGRTFSGTSLGVGGPGGWGWSTGGNGGGFTGSEISQINAITDAFSDSIENRGGPSNEFANWGGAVSFDNDASADWHWDHTISPGSSDNDFYSVALHELVHTLGFGTSSEFSDLISGLSFTGSESVAAFGGSVPLDSGLGHWQEGLTSPVFGGSASQEVLMDPTAVRGERILVTTVDAAALSDIGWDVVAPTLPGDYDLDGDVDAADYVYWQDRVGTPEATGSYAEWSANYGSTLATSTSVPEPGSAVLTLLFTASAAARRTKLG